ncbi:hypothetical protein HaLaN_28573, partial [Haematococcus lacustris]
MLLVAWVQLGGGGEQQAEAELLKALQAYAQEEGPGGVISLAVADVSCSAATAALATSLKVTQLPMLHVYKVGREG